MLFNHFVSNFFNEYLLNLREVSFQITREYTKYSWCKNFNIYNNSLNDIFAGTFCGSNKEIHGKRNFIFFIEKLYIQNMTTTFNLRTQKMCS